MTNRPAVAGLQLRSGALFNMRGTGGAGFRSKPTHYQASCRSALLAMRREGASTAAGREYFSTMSPSENENKVDKPASRPDVSKEGDPEWTTGLKRLYDSVLDEPLPDAFADLLAKLDKDGGR